MGHSFGGTLTQLLLARGLGSAGVVIDSAPTEGVRVNPLSQARSLFPALKNPANRHKAVGFTPEEFHYAFTNTLTEEDSQAVWDRYAIAAPGNWVWEYGLFANFKPGHQDTWVDYAADRAPLLFIAGAKDHIMPPSVNRSNAKHYKQVPARHRVPRVRGPRPHGPAPRPGGRPSPTTHSSGRNSTPASPYLHERRRELADSSVCGLSLSKEPGSPSSPGTKGLTARCCRLPHQICRGRRRFNTYRAKPTRAGSGPSGRDGVVSRRGR